MDEIIMRRLKHLQWLEENHEKDFQERLGVDTAEAEKRREEVADALSADWNGKRQTSISPVPGGAAFALVPPDGYYKIIDSNGGNFSAWVELS